MKDLSAQGDHVVLRPAPITGLRLADAGQDTRFEVVSAGPFAVFGHAAPVPSALEPGDIVHALPNAADRIPFPDGEAFVVRASSIFAKEVSA